MAFGNIQDADNGVGNLVDTLIVRMPGLIPYKEISGIDSYVSIGTLQELIEHLNVIETQDPDNAPRTALITAPGDDERLQIVANTIKDTPGISLQLIPPDDSHQQHGYSYADFRSLGLTINPDTGELTSEGHTPIDINTLIVIRGGNNPIEEKLEAVLIQHPLRLLSNEQSKKDNAHPMHINVINLFLPEDGNPLTPREQK